MSQNGRADSAQYHSASARINDPQIYGPAGSVYALYERLNAQRSAFVLEHGLGLRQLFSQAESKVERDNHNPGSVVLSRFARLQVEDAAPIRSRECRRQ